MSDGMTDKRSQSLPILNTDHRTKLETLCHDRFVQCLMENPDFDNFTLGQTRSIAKTLAWQVVLAAEDLTS